MSVVARSFTGADAGENISKLTGCHAARRTLATLLGLEELGDFVDTSHNVVTFLNKRDTAAARRCAEIAQGVVIDGCVTCAGYHML